jgi:hypothetical protein
MQVIHKNEIKHELPYRYMRVATRLSTKFGFRSSACIPLVLFLEKTIEYPSQFMNKKGLRAAIQG